MNKLLLSGNNIIIKGNRIILPDSLSKKVKELAHRGTHVGQSGLARRLRSAFFLP